MDNERRYDEEEIAEIFSAAAAPTPLADRSLGRARGLTLPELREIGREVGMDPDRVSAAAMALDSRKGVQPRKTLLGSPIGVGRIASLPRAPTDEEWGVLLSDLRATFGAHGRDRSDGVVRRWTNGNLHAVIEPTAAGYQLRIGTRKGDASSVTLMGAAWLVLGLVLLVGSLLGGAEDLFLGLLLSSLGAGLFGYNAVRLPRWAEEREEQMEWITGRTHQLLASGGDLPSRSDGAD